MGCGVCSHPRRSDIERATAAGGDPFDVAARFNVPKLAVEKHRTHAPTILAAAPSAASNARPRSSEALPTAREMLADLVGRIRNLMEEAEADGTLKDRAAIQRSEMAAVKLYAQLTGELGATEGTVIASPHFKRATRKIQDALAPHPEALAAVVLALESLEAA